MTPTVAPLVQQCDQGRLAATQLVGCGQAREVGVGGLPAAVRVAPGGLVKQGRELVDGGRQQGMEEHVK